MPNLSFFIVFAFACVAYSFKNILIDSINISSFKYIIGVDEVGRGSLAGPVVASSFFLPNNVIIGNLKDSKLFRSEEERELAYESLVNQKSIMFETAIVNSTVIDKLNILQATFKAMKESTICLLKKLNHLNIDKNATLIIIDGNKVPPSLLQNVKDVKICCKIKGDALIPAISGASIIAKVSRDKLMNKMADLYPNYGFEKHKGYGTKFHLKNIAKYGCCNIHRKSFRVHKSSKVCL